MLNKHNLNVALVAAKEESRFTLNAIRVTPKETVATDGHILVRVTTPTGTTADSFPEIQGQPKATDEFVPFNLPAKAALEAVKALPKPKRGVNGPELQNVAVAVNGHAQVMTTDLENYRTWKETPGTFPDYERVIPNLEDAKLSIIIDAALLKQVCEQVIGFKGKITPRVQFWFTDPKSAVYFRANGGDEQVLDGCVMPCREE